MLEQSQHIFSHIKYAREAIEEIKNAEGGSLKIGVLPGSTLICYLMLC